MSIIDLIKYYDSVLSDYGCVLCRHTYSCKYLTNMNYGNHLKALKCKYFEMDKGWECVYDGCNNQLSVGIRI